MNTGVMFSKATDEWETPQDLYDQLHAEFDFGVDAAARRENAKCHLWFGPGGLCEDALALKDWRADDSGRAVWMNPPYSACRAFMAKARAMSLVGGMPVVCLVPSRTDTRWWHDHVWDDYYREPWPGVEVRFLRGRLKFGESKNSAPFPSVIVIFRPPT